MQVVQSAGFCLLLELEGEVIYQEKVPSLGVFNLQITVSRKKAEDRTSVFVRVRAARDSEEIKGGAVL